MDQYTYLATITKSLFDFSKADILCDTTVVAKNCEFTAHSAVLAAASPTLRSAFVNSIAEKTTFRIELPEADGSIVERILYLIYTGDLLPESKLTTKELGDLMLTCEQLGLDWIFANSQKESENLESSIQQLTGANTESTSDNNGEFFEPCEQRLNDYSAEFPDDCKNISLDLFKDHMPKISENLLLDREVEEDGQHIKFCCDLCSIVFDNPDDLETHVICHNTLTLTCERCGSQFENALSFQQHTEIHEGKVGALKAECEVLETICAEDCKSASDIAVDSCCDGERLFCSLCAVAFDNETQFESHRERFHSTEQLFVCFQCKKSFAEKNQLKKHLVAHESSRNFACEVCNRSFSQEYYLKKHRRTHRSSLDYICPSCGKQFKLLEYLKAHMKSHCNLNNDSSGDNSQKMHHCAVCSQAFSHHSYLKSHAKIHAVEKPYECKTCGKRVKVNCIQQHMQTHSAERVRPYGCDKCGRRFTRHADLQAHLQTHSGTKSHCCPICARGFHKKCDVQRHIRIHTGERPYVCETCGKSFKILFHLRLHSYVHSTDRPHQCNSCGKTFSSALRLKKHEFTHSGICPYACPICSRRFNRQANMRSHMKTHGQKSEKALDPVTENGPDVVYETAGNNLEEVQSTSDNLEMVFYKFEKPEVFVALPLDSIQNFKL